MTMTLIFLIAWLIKIGYVTDDDKNWLQFRMTLIFLIAWLSCLPACTRCRPPDWSRHWEKGCFASHCICIVFAYALYLHWHCIVFIFVVSKTIITFPTFILASRLMCNKGCQRWWLPRHFTGTWSYYQHPPHWANPASKSGHNQPAFGGPNMPGWT